MFTGLCFIASWFHTHQATIKCFDSHKIKAINYNDNSGHDTRISANPLLHTCVVC